MVRHIYKELGHSRTVCASLQIAYKRCLRSQKIRCNKHFYQGIKARLIYVKRLGDKKANNSRYVSHYRHQPLESTGKVQNHRSSTRSSHRLTV